MVERSTDLDERLEALQDDVDLLKNEVKQTLVDLREFIMKDRTLLPQVIQAPAGTPQRPPGPDGGGVEPVPAGLFPPGFPAIPPVSGMRRPGLPLRDLQSEAHASGALTRSCWVMSSGGSAP